MSITEQNEKIDQALTTLRSLGYAVVAFTPEELGACSTEDRVRAGLPPFSEDTDD